MSIIVLNKTLIKKNIFLDSVIWSIASDNAKQKNISVAQEIRSKLAEVYSQNIESRDSKYILDRSKKRRDLAGSIASDPNTDVNGAINHNDIYSL